MKSWKGFVGEYKPTKFLLNINPQYKKEIKTKINALLKRYKYTTRLIRHSQVEAIIEICATSKEVREFILSLKPYGIHELMRTGRVAIA